MKLAQKSVRTDRSTGDSGDSVHFLMVRPSCFEGVM